MTWRIHPFTFLANLVLLVIVLPGPVQAGGFLTRSDFTGFEPSPFPGEVLIREAPVFWDTRCIPTPYKVDVSVDPLPNPLGEDFLTIADVIPAVERAMQSWNDIPTSYVEFRLDGTDPTPGFGFDMVNDISFVTFPGAQFLAFSASVSIGADNFLPAGLDLDGDGDVDVAEIEVCADVDQDGDHEIPAGFYQAGAILDNDVVFATEAFRFTVRDEDLDTHFFSVDFEAVLAHELGHSHGLAHTLVNQISPTDGTAATMFPFLDTGDPVAERAVRSLARDDIGFSSLSYPEGSAAEGPAALQPGDVAFDDVYGVIEGEVRHGALGVSIAGANVAAVDQETGEVVASVYSGTVVRSISLSTFQTRLLPGFDSVVHGRYRLPVPEGTYAIEVEPLDGAPVSAISISTTTIVGSLLGLHEFPEERFHQGEPEAALELFPGAATPIPVQPGQMRSGVDLVTNRVKRVATFDPPGAFGGLATGPPGAYLAQEIPAELIAAADTGEQLVIHSALFFTLPFDSPNVPIAAEAMLTTGRVLGGNLAEVDVDDPLARVAPFIAQDIDWAPAYFQNPVALGERVREVLAAGETESFFLVLKMPDDGSVPDFNLVVRAVARQEGEPDGAYFSLDGITFFDSPIPVPLDFTLSLSDSP